MLPGYVEKYLKKFSLDNWKLESSGRKEYNLIVVIPALEEYEGIKKLISSLMANEDFYLRKTLFIFVINNLASTEKQIKKNNLTSLEYLRAIMAGKYPLDFPPEFKGKSINLGIVDAATTGNELPEKDGGVGLARKIGMDLALSKFDYSGEYKNILVCLDGDCTVEPNYLRSIWNNCNDKNIKAGYVKYFHLLPADPESRLAIINYEIFLRYYVMGLKIAGSPYAFHTIGSTMLCDAESYTKIQGMNKRKAAEDFYFMEKLSKITGIVEITDTCIYPSNRPSWRVPFGTGQRVRRFLNKEQDEYILYSFKSFLLLKKWIELFYNNNFNSKTLMEKARGISNHLFDFLADQKFDKSWDKVLSDSPGEIQLLKQKNFLFDGFKTLKLIHYLRDNQFPPENMFDVLDEVLEYMGLNKNLRMNKEKIPPQNIQEEYLNILRSLY